MAKIENTFSESWHRIANLKICLRSTVKVRRQIFRGKKYYVVFDPFNNNFYRLTPEAYEFVSNLRPDETVEKTWEKNLIKNPDTAPGQEEVLQLLTQLHHANLLYFKSAADSAKLFERFKKRKQREIRSKLFSIMFMRIPVFDPDNILKKFNTVTTYLTGKAGFVVWLTVVIFALKMVADNFNLVTEQAQGILAPDNLFLLYAGMVFVKTIHEFGHAAVCRRYGGEVHTMGVMLLVFTPLPYMDATSSWSFRSRWHRAFVGFAGMYVEIFIAALATFVWAKTGQGVIHSLAYNIMFIASVSTLLFNGNPLLRFDGYYILSDLLNIPNLSTRSMNQLKHLAEKYLFGYRESISSSNNMKEAFLLITFGILSGIYRVFVFTGIIIFVADKFMIVGLILAVVCLVSWLLMPPYKLIKYLATSNHLAKTRVRAVSVCVAITTFVVIFLAVCPFPSRFRAPGVLESTEYLKVTNESSGYVEEILVESGTPVKKGDKLARLSDNELEIEVKISNAQKAETLAMQKRAMSTEIADLKPLQKRLEATETKLNELQRQQQNLIVRAKQSGIWVSHSAKEMKGTWLSKGSMIGEIVNPDKFRFSTIVAQDDAANLFVDRIKKAEVRIAGHAETNLDVTTFSIIPFQHEKLPSAALGWLAGGDVAVSSSDETGTTATEPFFQIYAELSPNKDVIFLQGRRGKLRFTMNSEPLLKQWMRSLRQLLQKRYHI